MAYVSKLVSAMISFMSSNIIIKLYLIEAWLEDRKSHITVSWSKYLDM